MFKVMCFLFCFGIMADTSDQGANKIIVLDHDTILDSDDEFGKLKKQYQDLAKNMMNLMEAYSKSKKDLESKALKAKEEISKITDLSKSKEAVEKFNKQNKELIEADTKAQTQMKKMKEDIDKVSEKMKARADSLYKGKYNNALKRLVKKHNPDLVINQSGKVEYTNNNLTQELIADMSR